MKKITCSLFGLLLLASVSCGSDQNGAQPTTDKDAAVNLEEESSSPTGATSSAGSSGMGGSVSAHALASDTLTDDSTQQR